MKKMIAAAVSALALPTLAACSDTGTSDNTTTQSTNPPAGDTAPAGGADAGSGAMKPLPADPAAPAQ